MKDLKKRTLRGASWLGIQNLLAFILSFGTNVALARILAPEDFGAVAAASALVAFLSHMATIGIRPEIIRLDSEKSDYTEWLSSFFWINAIFVISAFLIIFLVSQFTEILNENAKKIVLIVAGGWALNQVLLPSRALLHKQMRYGLISLLGISVPLIIASIGIPMALFGFGVLALAIPQATALVVTGVIATLISRPPVTLRYRNKSLKYMRQKFMWYIGHGLSSSGFTNLDDLLIGKYLGDQTLGFYNRSYLLGRLLHEKFGSILYSIGLPVLSNPKISKEQKITYVSLCLKVCAYLILPFVILLAIHIEHIISFIYGDRWIQSAIFFIYLTPFSVMWVVCQVFKAKIVADGEIRYQSIVDTLKLVLMLAGSFLLIEDYGVLGVAVAVNSSLAVAMILLGYRAYSGRCSDFKVMLLPIIYAVIVVMSTLFSYFSCLLIIFLSTILVLAFERKDLNKIISGL